MDQINIGKRRDYSTWDLYEQVQTQSGISKEILELSNIFLQELMVSLKLSPTDIKLGDSMVTYYVEGEIFGNVRFNKTSIRIEPLFAGNTDIGYKIQTDGYAVHSFKISTLEEYYNYKALVFQQLSKVCEMKRSGTYASFIDKFEVRLKKYLGRMKR